MSDLQKKIVITSAVKAAYEGKITGTANTKILFLYDMLYEYDEYTRDMPAYQKYNRFIKDEITTLKYRYPDIICNIKAVLPKVYITDEEAAEAAIPTITPVLSNFTVNTAKQKLLNGDNTLYDTYSFNNLLIDRLY
jgi:hypothetical protein